MITEELNFNCVFNKLNEESKFLAIWMFNILKKLQEDREKLLSKPET